MSRFHNRWLNWETPKIDWDGAEKRTEFDDFEQKFKNNKKNTVFLLYISQFLEFPNLVNGSGIYKDKWYIRGPFKKKEGKEDNLQ